MGPMKRTSFAESECPIARTVDLIGDWWTPLVVREAFYGRHRFDDMQRALGIGRNVLAERLRRLADEGLLARVEYQDHPPRFEYRLTQKGEALLPVLAAMLEWGTTWLAPKRAPPVGLRHRTCGKRLRVSVVCAECHRPIEASEVQVEPAAEVDAGDGAGANSDTSSPPKGRHPTRRRRRR
jgi:DNA-binding HxlR family transcriptional regulator